MPLPSSSTSRMGCRGGNSTAQLQTQVLGGKWAIFADGFVPPPGGVKLIDGDIVLSGTFISTNVDLTKIASTSVEQFFVDGSEDGLLFFVGIVIDNILVGPLRRLGVVEPGNLSLRATDVSSTTG